MRPTIAQARISYQQKHTSSSGIASTWKLRVDGQTREWGRRVQPTRLLLPRPFPASPDSNLHGLSERLPWNWLQDWENTMDPFHVVILHTAFSGPQFNPDMAVMPDVEWAYTPLGMQYAAHRRFADGQRMDRITHVMFPSLRSVPNIQLSHGVAESMGWLVPVDDTHHRTFHITRMPLDFEGVPLVTAPVLETRWSDMTEEERWRTPGDWEIQKGQGPITLHSEERLASSDTGVAMLRRRLREQIRVVREGGDPIGVRFDPDAPPYRIGAGNFYRDRAAARR